MTVLHAPADVETMHPVDVLRWTFDTYGVENVVVTVSFQGAGQAQRSLTASTYVRR